MLASQSVNQSVNQDRVKVDEGVNTCVSGCENTIDNVLECALGDAGRTCGHISGPKGHGDGRELLLQQGTGHEGKPMRAVAANHQQTTTLRLSGDADETVLR